MAGVARRFRFVLIGDPVAHSRSPAIHQEALRLSGLDGEYRAVRADRAGMEEAVQALREGALQGINVTMPLKEGAAQLADTVTPLARRAASVNTLRLRAGMVEGHSTDAEALASIVQGEGFGQLASVLILGAGGSARAAVAVLGDRSVYLSARDPGKAAAAARWPGVDHLVAWGDRVDGALVVNATPLGMSGEELPRGVAEAAGGLVDLPYGSVPTPATRAAHAAGIPLVDGLEFLAAQAAASFLWWTGEAVHLAALTRVARNT